MMRSCLLLMALVGPFAMSDRSMAAYRDEIIPETTAARHGLTRMWFSQVQLDRSRARVVHVLLDRGTLFVQTDKAMLHALDAETGQTLWAVQVGRRDHPSLRPAANQDLVAVINGSYLYVVNRHNGKQLWDCEIEGAPGAGPAMSDERAYVACVNGIVLSYMLQPVKAPRQEPGIAPADESSAEGSAPEAMRRESLRIEQDYVPPLVCQSAGRAIVQPIITRENEGEEYVAWPTDRGFLFVGRIDRNEQNQFAVRYRLTTEAGIAARPTYLPPEAGIVGDSGIIYAASRDGYVHAVRENSGTALWRFSTGEPLVEPAVVVDKRVFAATQPGGMYCLDAKSGSQIWWAPDLLQFIASSKNRLYAVDRLNRMVVLDVSTGARLDALPFPTQAVRMYNDQNDRIYLVSESGLVQCLREVENVEPIVHRVPPKTRPAEPPAAKKPAGAEPEEAAPGAPAPNPFDAPAPAADDPFGAAAGNPFN
jgi:outer membrane protein assembly factor BamB